MSASSEQVSGAHSGGFTTTVFPAASAGPIFQVVSIIGAFQGVIERRDAGRVVAHVVGDLGRVDRVALELRRRPVGEERDVERRARHHALQVARQERAVVDGLDRGELRGARLDALPRSACRIGSRPPGPRSAQAGNARARRGDRGVDLGRAAGRRRRRGARRRSATDPRTCRATPPASRRSSARSRPRLPRPAPSSQRFPTSPSSRSAKRSRSASRRVGRWPLGNRPSMAL